MDASRRSRKRKQPPNPLQGILTRSRSQVYVHSRRSGRSRSDLSWYLKSELPRSVRRHDPNRQPRPNLNHLNDTSIHSVPGVQDLKSEERATEAENKTAFISIKDLRARRVFSKPLNNPSVELFDVKDNPNLVTGEFKCSQKSLLREQSHCLDVVGGNLISRRDGNKKVDLGFNIRKEGVNDENPNCSESRKNLDTESKASEPEEKFSSDPSEKLAGLSCTDGSSKYSILSFSGQGKSAGLSSEQQQNGPDPVRMLDVEDIQITPPDINVLDKVKEHQTVTKSKMPLNGSHAVSRRLNHNKIDSHSSSKFVLYPCSRLKVFKSASSFSYKRLLPYLMDISKVKSGVSTLFPTRIQDLPAGDVNIQEELVSPCSKTEGKDEEKPSEQSEASLTHESNERSQSQAKKYVESVQRRSCSERTEEVCKEANIGALKDNHATEETTPSFSLWDIEAPPQVSDVQSLTHLSIEQQSEFHSSAMRNLNLTEGPRQKLQSSVKNKETLRSELAVDALDHADFYLKESCRSSNPIFSNQEERANLSIEQERDSSEPVQLVEDENIQTTPPDTNVLDKIEDNLSGANTEEKMLPLDRNLQVFPVCSPNKRNAFNLSRKLVLNYKTANSLSYRRLLPYLMDMEKDKTGSIGVDPCFKTENREEEKPFVQSEASGPQQNLAYSYNLEKNRAENCPGSDRSERAEEVCKESTTGSLKENHATETSASFVMNDIQATSPTSDGRSQMQLANNSSEVVAPVEHQSELHNSTACGSGPAEGCHHMSQSLTKARGTSGTELAGDFPQRTGSSFKGCRGSDNCVECKRGKKRKNCDDKITVFQSSTPIINVCSSELMVVGEKKGILKRNPRGCRGLCTCLYCSSFRQNAERAFEFSRNQLHDTEELVLHLVKELSQVRNVLKETVDDSDSDAINQVEEIYEKAEDLATTRLREMNEDLSAHCRTKNLNRPSVNFAL